MRSPAESNFYWRSSLAEVGFSLSVSYWKEAVIMKASLFPVLVLTMLGAVHSHRHSERHCRDNWILFQHSCYGLGQEYLDWPSAVAVCYSHGARLAEIQTKQEDEFLMALAKSHDVNITWLGGTDIFAEGQWTWASTGVYISSHYSNWAQGKPDNYQNENCLSYFKNRNFLWDDIDCKKLGLFICEKRFYY